MAPVTRKPPRCLVRSPLSTAELHREYVKSLTDEQLHGDGPYTIHERTVTTATHRKSEQAPDHLTGFAATQYDMAAEIMLYDADYIP